VVVEAYEITTWHCSGVTKGGEGGGGGNGGGGEHAEANIVVESHTMLVFSRGNLTKSGLMLGTSPSALPGTAQ
jgi:hypothetical protein